MKAFALKQSRQNSPGVSTRGVDYQGDLARFEQEFNDDCAVIAHAVGRYSLPSNLKLSVHSGSDKFSLYPIIRRSLRRTGAGLHLKTAGTTWLEELIGLAEVRRRGGLRSRKRFTPRALDHVEELCGPYASVISIDQREVAFRAGSPKMEWARWYVNALRVTSQTTPNSNPHFRQLLHVAFKLAAKAGKPLSEFGERKRVDRGAERHGKYLRATHAPAALCRMKSAVTISLVPVEGQRRTFYNFWDLEAEVKSARLRPNWVSTPWKFFQRPLTR